MFQHLLNKDDETNDHVVRVTAARQFKTVVDDFGFEPEGKPDFLESTVSLFWIISGVVCSRNIVSHCVRQCLATKSPRENS